MRVIICGAGQVGYGIAERLAAEKNDVSVIDTSPELIRGVRDSLDVRGFRRPRLASGGAGGRRRPEADMIIAVTLYDEVNIVACEVAHALFNVPTKIARIRAQSYLQPHYQDLFSREHLPIDVIISPELEVGEMVLRRIALPGATDVVRFAENKIADGGDRMPRGLPGHQHAARAAERAVSRPAVDGRRRRATASCSSRTRPTSCSPATSPMWSRRRSRCGGRSACSATRSRRRRGS
jgi:hypothetical protein